MWMRELRYAARMFAGTPGFTLVALVTLALGIGANTAIFSVIDNVLLRRAPIPGIDRLAVVWETDRNTGTFREPGSLPDFLDYRRRSRRIEDLAAFVANEVNYTPEHGEPARLQALEVTAEFLPTLGVRAAIGRGFTAEEARPGGPAVAILSDAVWARFFGRDRAILGRTVRIDDQQVTVVGVLPHGSDFGVFQILRAADYSRSFADRGARAGVDIWLPLQDDASSLPRSTHPLFMVARLNDNVVSLQQELAGIAVDLAGVPGERCARHLRGAAEPRGLRARTAGVAGAARSRWAGAARGVRERGEPAARARDLPAPRSRRPNSTRRGRPDTRAPVRG